jgi:GT2 family glycosyltransferase
MSIDATVTAGYQSQLRIVYKLPKPSPLVSLVIGTRDKDDLLRQIVAGVLDRTDYETVEIIIVDNQSSSPSTLAYLDKISADPRVTVLSFDAPFNFSAINNLGVRAARGTIVGLLNNDLKVIASDWLREMVSQALRPEIGAVGAKLLFPNDTIQHGGIILGVGGVAGHAHKYLPRDSNGYIHRAVLCQNFSAVTGACMVLRKEVFDEVGGFNELDLPVAYNDVDLCLRIRKKGYRILWTPYAELYHLESASRGPDDSPENELRYNTERDYVFRTWGREIIHDAHYNPNLTIAAEDFSLAVPPRTVSKWR